MPYVVKNKETGLFLRSTGDWTRFISEAQQFPNGRSIPLHLEARPYQTLKAELEILRLPLG